MDFLSRLSNKSIDWALIDPEYGIGASKPSKKPNSVLQRNGRTLRVNSTNYNHSDWDNLPAPYEFFEEIFRTTKDQFIWGCNYYNYPMPGGRLVWDKLNEESDQFDCEIAYVSNNRRTDLVYYKWSGMMQGLVCSRSIKKAIIQQGNKSLNEKRIHPTQKPVKLYKWILSEYVGPNKTIIDTGAGSASIIIAFQEMVEYWETQGIDCSNSKLICCENDKIMFEKSIKRIQEELKTSLFTTT